jgi:hypothetical protein
VTIVKSETQPHDSINVIVCRCHGAADCLKH